jgi:hypothetical protein
MQEAILARTNASLITGLSMYLEGLAEPGPPERLVAIFEKSHANSRSASCVPSLEQACRRKCPPGRRTRVW